MLRFWTNSALHVSFGAGVLSAATAYFLQADSPLTFFVFAFFGTWCVYLAQRIFKGKKNGITQIQNHIVSHKKSYGPLAAFVGIIAAALAAILDFYFLLLAASGFILSILYIYFPGKKGSLRKSPWLKILLVAWVWTLVTAIIPAYNDLHQLNWSWFSLFLLERFLFISLITIPFDIRDLLRDAPTQKTIPMLLGMKNTKVLLAFLFICIVAIVWHLFQTGIYSKPIAAGLLISYGISFILSMLSKVSFKESYFTFWLEGMLFLPAISLFLFESSL